MSTLPIPSPFQTDRLLSQANGAPGSSSLLGPYYKQWIHSTFSLELIEQVSRNNIQLSLREINRPNW